jgi:hypothetical protein
MSAIPYSSFMNFCKVLQGQTLTTAGGLAQFTLSSVQDNQLEYIVQSTGKTRRSRQEWIKKILNHYAITQSLRPVDYVDVTVNASYILTLMKLYIASYGKS